MKEKKEWNKPVIETMEAKETKANDFYGPTEGTATTTRWGRKIHFGPS